MKAPFELLDRQSAKTLSAGHAALRKKKYELARDLFHQVVAARPDHTDARYQEMRATLLSEPSSDVADLWRELLARDLVSYSGRLDKHADFASLRKSAAFTELTKIQTEVGAAYAQGLDKGVVFVARSRPAKPQLYDENARPILELFQEAYHLDVGTGRVRRLTATGGKVFAVLPDTVRKQLMLLLVDALSENEADTGWSFLTFKAAVLSLETLSELGPAVIPAGDGPASQVVMCISAKGGPLWVTDSSHAFDSAKKALVKATETCAPGSGVKVTVNRGVYQRVLPTGVALDLQKALTINGSPSIQGKDLIRSESIGWSPGKTRLVFAGDMDPCNLQRDDEGDSPASAKNDLNVWDPLTKKATRVAEAFSYFEWEWLDDDHLAYETGSKSNPRVAVHTFSSQTDAVVETHAGAGLIAVPRFACADATTDREEAE